MVSSHAAQAATDEQRIHGARNDVLSRGARASDSSWSKVIPLALIGCLISDIELPGMDGWSLERLVLDRRPLVPIIIVTAHGEIDALRKVKCLNDSASVV